MTTKFREVVIKMWLQKPLFKGMQQKIAQWGLGAVALLLVACGGVITNSTEVYEYKIPMGEDSVLVYKATTYYENNSEENCSLMGCEDLSYSRRLKVTIDYCIEVSGVQNSCVKGIPYSTNTSQPLVSTYEKGLYILDFLKDDKAVGGVKFLQKIWNWETGVNRVDTLVQSTKALPITWDNDALNGGVGLYYKLLTVALTDEGFFLRIGGTTNDSESGAIYHYLNTNSANKMLQKTNMDWIDTLGRNGQRQNVLKCKLGQWSYGGDRFCGMQIDNYSDITTRVEVNDSLIFSCVGSLGGGFIRLYKDYKNIDSNVVRWRSRRDKNFGQEMNIKGDICQ